MGRLGGVAVLLGLAGTAAGCGLTLDYGPPSSTLEQRDVGQGGMDAGAPRDAGRSDGGIDTGAEVVDAVVPTDDTGNTTLFDVRDPAEDAFVPPLDVSFPFDVSISLDGSGSLETSVSFDGTTSLDASLPDVFIPFDGAPSNDVGTDAPMRADVGPDGSRDSGPDARSTDAGRDTSAGACMGLPGSGSMCDTGTCFCEGSSLCYPVTDILRCCPSAFTCAPPLATCNAQHPITGPPRTCTSGFCYCANPDACFPFATASTCCPGPVSCVP